MKLWRPLESGAQGDDLYHLLVLRLRGAGFSALLGHPVAACTDVFSAGRLRHLSTRTSRVPRQVLPIIRAGHRDLQRAGRSITHLNWCVAENHYCVSPPSEIYKCMQDFFAQRPFWGYSINN